MTFGHAADPTLGVHLDYIICVLTVPILQHSEMGIATDQWGVLTYGGPEPTNFV